MVQARSYGSRFLAGMSRRKLLASVAAGLATPLVQACAPSSPLPPPTTPFATKATPPAAPASSPTAPGSVAAKPTAAAAPPTPTPRPLFPLKMGFPAPLFWQAPLSLGVSKGIYSRRAISLETANYDRSDLSIKAMLTGETPVGSFNAPGQINAIAEGAEIKIIGSINPGNPYLLAVTRRISSFEDLYTYPFGIAGFGTYPHIAAVGLLVKKGIDPDKITWANVGGAATGFAALQAGKCDAEVVTSEFLPRIEADPNLKVLASLAEDLAELLPGTVAVQSKFARESRDRVVDFLAATIESVRYALAHKAEVVEQEIKRLGRDREELEKSFDWYAGHKIWSPDLSATVKQLEFTQEINAKVNKGVKKLSVEQIFDPSFQQAALALLK